MDLKGKSWVGSIYQKFEAICQEADDFVSKDTVKYVANRVQSIGVSFNRLYSDVVQDVIPPLDVDIKSETQSVIGKQADIRDHDTSISSNMTKFFLDGKQLPVDQGSSGTLKKCDRSRWSDVGLVTRSTATQGADSFEETNSDVSLQEDGDTMIWNDSGEGVEGKNSKVMIPVTFNTSSKNKILSMASDEENQVNHGKCNITLAMASSPSLSAHEDELLAFKQQGSICYSFSDEEEYFSNVPSNGWLSEAELPLVLDFILDEDKSLPEPPEASADKGHQHCSPPIDSATLLACDAAHKPLRTCETLHNSFSTKDQIMASNAVQSSELVFSYCSCDDEKAERSVISSGQYTQSKSLNLLDSASANYTLMAENICSTPVGSNCYNHHISVVHAYSPSSTTVFNEVKAVDMLPPVSIIKSNDYNASATHGPVSVVSSESQRLQCYMGAQSTLLLSPSESGLDIGELNMETIDLSTDEKCDVFNTNLYVATPYRQKNIRYYKKLFKDAFASRKRLSKEYQHLAILHGDIDMESKHYFEQSSLPSSSTTSLHRERSLPSNEICDSEWEVV